MSHRELLKKFPKQGVQGAKPSAGVAGYLSTVGFLEVQEAMPPARVWGVPKSSLSSFSPQEANKKGKRSFSGTPEPRKGAAAPLNPATEADRQKTYC